MNVADLPDDSDSSDEDYMPEGKTEDIPSEVDSDGDSEDPLSDSEELSKTKKGKRAKKNSSKPRKKPTKRGQEKELANDANNSDAKLVHEEVKKKEVDDLWADFMKDTGFTPKNARSETSSPLSKTNNSTKVNVCEVKSSSTTQPQTQKSKEKVKITQVFEFAGEEVRVEKEVDANSAQGRLLNSEANIPKTSTGKRTAGLSGIGSVLSQLGKKQKISTLEKTKLDWDKFKKEEKIEEELRTYNKGKDGYLDRQDFLQRADLRRFEIEKDIRNTERSKRFNSTL